MFESSPPLAETKGILGECLLAQKRYDDAERVLTESYEAFKVNQIPRSFRIKEAIIRLISLYEAWHKPELAAHYRVLVDE